MELHNAVGARIPTHMLPVGEAMMTMSGLVLMQSDGPAKGSLLYWDRVDETWGQVATPLSGF